MSCHRLAPEASYNHGMGTPSFNTCQTATNILRATATLTFIAFFSPDHSLYIAEL
ncbi:hypothetical protein HMPREF1057_02996 [Bacteroides finegoldii CL09T03C10]|uniref:Uncharacterized protein n=1 Tax=Bacteroides finegoldii CL09T03C10 TaxID=997888 RepID=K5CJH6_9BACE|nr:hypothetical protein HMPREF1057_02996 [Bacteroides finegoldii CL09T03C10]